MTSSDTLDDMTPPAPPPPATPRRLRRVHDGRVGAGVAAGLGDYFGLDPVLFRVLFATSAFFGGAGIIAYLLAWAAIPDVGTERAPIDRWIDELRRRRVPLWMVVGGAGLFIWLIAFSWWAPGRFLPAVGAVVLVLFLVARRDQRRGQWTPPPAAPPVDLRKHVNPMTETTPTPPPPPRGAEPQWVAHGRTWFEESRTARRARRRRAQPVRIATLIVLLVTLGVLALIDALTGIPMQVYFWSALGVVVVGLVAGLVLRRAPFALAVLAVPFALGTIAFTGSSAGFTDGTGQRTWAPTVSHDYRLAFGQGTLNLADLPTNVARHVDVTVGAGQAVIVVPRTKDVTVNADVRFGNVEVDGKTLDNDAGVSVERTVRLASGTGGGITVDVHVSAGNVSIERR